MAEGDKRIESVPDPDLESLLDDAFEDFNKPSVPVVVAAPQEADQPGGPQAGDSNVWTEEFIKQSTQRFEQTMRTLLEQQQGATAVASTAPTPVPAPAPSNPGQIPEMDFANLSAELSKFAETAAKSATEAQTDSDYTKALADSLKQLNQSTEQIKGTPTADDLTKMFESMGIMGDSSEGGGADANGLFPLMQVMLENILSKEVLYTPMKEIVEKYPDWLADHRSSLPQEEFERYNKQFDIMKQVVELYDAESDTDTEEIKSQRFEKIMTSMQKLQELGQPPKDLVGDMGPMINFDESGNPQMPDMSSLFGGMGGLSGFPGMGGANMSGMPPPPTGGSQDGTQQPPGADEQCCVM
ncbi:unnamed protein product [Meganyctiphanes norvegica]|uniref:Peroxin-19 n=1 Tax=Meganyctiphanes norvegica TaxID=48144 RepID=A0AAV2SCP5_MEGNR